MSIKESETSVSHNEGIVSILGNEYKIYSYGTIVNLQEASASLGNILESKELLSQYHPEILKHSILSNSSNQLEELTSNDFIASEKRLYYFYHTLNNIKKFETENWTLFEHVALHGRIIKPDLVDGIIESFVAAMNDNFNTSLAVSEFQQVFKYSNALLKNAKENPLHKLTTLNKIYKNIIEAANLLGILLEVPEVFISKIKEKYIKLNNIDINEVNELMNLRNEAKSSKNYELSDELKAKLDQKGIIVLDSQFGSEWDIKQLYV
jgi:Cysteinyl-tRNA synthetase